MPSINIITKNISRKLTLNFVLIKSIKSIFIQYLSKVVFKMSILGASSVSKPMRVHRVVDLGLVAENNLR